MSHDPSSPSKKPPLTAAHSAPAGATHAFLSNLACFPAVPGANFRAAVEGENLDEHAVDDDELAGAVMEEPVPGEGRRLEEVEEPGEEVEAEPDEDPDDPIEDD